jgi:glycosyltransferase involved in cell wall biosynthesis
VVSQPGAARPPRAVVLVGNPASPYSRGLRIARTLVTAGYVVEIAAVALDGLPEREPGEGWQIRRYRASGPWARVGGSPGPGHTDQGPAYPRSGGPVGRLLRRTVGLAAALRRWIFWPQTVRGWWATLGRELEPADLYHACGSLTLAAALRARRRAPVGPAGLPAAVIYDAIDDVFESNNVLDMPRPWRAWHARRETRWAHAADAVITVNEALAARLGARWGPRLAPDVVPNYPEARADGGGASAANATLDPIRTELGLPAATRVILFQGRLGPRLGLDEAAEAVLLLPDAALVLLGFGRSFELECARDREPRFAGRHFTLPARHPDELLGWTAAADVALVPLPPVSVNQRLSSPNKFWEALVAGTPVVVPAALSYMAEIVRERDLGIVAASAGAADLALAISACLARLATDPGWRARIRATAGRDYTWPVAATTYRKVIARLA